MKGLTNIQNSVLTLINKYVDAGLPLPSLREIAGHFGFGHTTARFHLMALERKGFIKKRGQRVSDYMIAEDRSNIPGTFDLVATIPAGTPLAIFEGKEDTFTVDSNFFGGGQLKAVYISGDSMSGDSISDGDIGIIRLQKDWNKRDIVAVRVNGDEITLKRIRIKKNVVELIPSNPEFPVRSFPVEEVEVVGKLVGIIRKT
jgi:repressor LexA